MTFFRIPNLDKKDAGQQKEGVDTKNLLYCGTFMYIYMKCKDLHDGIGGDFPI